MSTPNFDSRYITPSQVDTKIATQAATDAGQYIAAPTTTWSVNPLTGRVHIPAVPQATDAGAVIQSALNWIAASSQPNGRVQAIQLAPATYYCQTPISTTSPISWFGSAPATTSIENDSAGNTGTSLVDCTATSSSTPFITIGTLTSSGPFLSCFSMRDIRITGQKLTGHNYPQHDALRLQRVGWEFSTYNVYIGRFAGAGLAMDGCYDATHTDMSIISCGGNTANGLRYAMELSSSDTTTVTNAQHFTNLHVEGSRYMVRLDYARHIFFTNSKFECGSDYFVDTTAYTDLTNSPFYFSSNCYEIDFSGSVLVARDVSVWLTANSSTNADTMPYVIKSDANRPSGSSGIQFTGCTFTTSESGATNFHGSKWFIGSSFHIIGGMIDTVTSQGTGQGTAINIARSELTGVKIVIATYGHVVQGTTAATIALGAVTLCNGCSIRTDGISSPTNLAATAFYINRAITPTPVIRGNQYWNVTTPVLDNNGVTPTDWTTYDRLSGITGATETLRLDPSLGSIRPGTTAGLGVSVFSGSGAPALSASVNDLYVRTDGSGSTLLYKCITAGTASAASWVQAMNFVSQTASLASSQAVTSTTATDLSGVSVTVTSPGTSATYNVTTILDISATAANTAALVANLVVDSSTQTGQVILVSPTSGQRGTVSQQWSITNLSAGAHTFKIQVLTNVAGGSYQVNSTHSNLKVMQTS